MGGHLTLEFSNSSGADCRIYANEGICQLLFLKVICSATYEDRKENIKPTRESNPRRSNMGKVELISLTPDARKRGYIARVSNQAIRKMKLFKVIELLY